MLNISTLGQVFTPQYIIDIMISLRKNFGITLEPSCGNGNFLINIPGSIGIEIDSSICPKNALNIDFFDFSTDNKFNTIIGNPPYVRYQDILSSTKNKLDLNLFDKRTNLYMFFIEKSIYHLSEYGELIFITPRNFFKATASQKLNKLIYNSGTITDYIDLGDKKIFNGVTPNCVIWRFEKGNYSRKLNNNKNFIYNNGQLLFTNNFYNINFKDFFYVKVGAISGMDNVFENEKYGNMEFVYSKTCKTGNTKYMLFNKYHTYLEQYKKELLNRGIKKFNENNWWKWGRSHYITNNKRVYVNCKTRNKHPFFTHKCINYDGSILAIFPNNQNIDIELLKNMLNEVDWDDIGFVCDGRYIFSQQNLENSVLPDNFKIFLNME